MVADILRKPLPRAKFKFLWRIMGVICLEESEGGFGGIGAIWDEEAGVLGVEGGHGSAGNAE